MAKTGKSDYESFNQLADDVIHQTLDDSSKLSSLTSFLVPLS
jgi:hypothetical protein